MAATVFPVKIIEKPNGKREKKPAIDGWQTSTMTRDQIKTKNYGVVVPDGVYLLDFDNPEAREALMAKYGVDINRGAYAQKTLRGEHYLYSIPDGLRMKQGANLLGIDGFDTRAPYRGWICTGDGYTTLLGPIEERVLAKLPPLPGPLINALIDSQPELRPVEPSRPSSQEQCEDLRDALSHVDAEDYDLWVRVGMALYGVPGGFRLWDEWSQQSDKYNSQEMEAKFNSFANTAVTPSTVFWLAQNAGWDNPKSIDFDDFDPSDFDIDPPEDEAIDFEGLVRLPDFCLEGLIQRGLVLFAGQSGAGKTTTLLPMAIAATGLLPSYPAQPKLAMRVLYYAEDRGQAIRCIRALHDSLLLAGDINEKFVVRQAKRILPAQYAKAVEGFDLVIFDTAMNCFPIEDENSNSEIAGLIAGLRQNLDCSVWVVSHVSKAARDTENISVRGASAWQDSAQQVVGLTYSEGERYLDIIKHRFEYDDYEGASSLYKITTHTTEGQGVDILGEILPISMRYNWLETDSKTDRSTRRLDQRNEANRKRGEEQRMETEARIAAEVVDLLREVPGQSIPAIQARIMGQSNVIRDVIKAMTRKGELSMTKVGREHRYSVNEDHSDVPF